jgi:hypothetical protein
MAAPTSTATTHYHNQPNPKLSWVDEFLGFTSTRQGYHRRSVSDGVTFIETSGPFAQFVDQDHQHHNGALDHLDDDKLLSMFTDDMSLDNMQPPTSNTATSSPLSSTLPDKKNNNEDQSLRPCDHISENLSQLQAMQQPQPLGEINSLNKFSKESLGLQISTDGDSKADPKRVKRILANRQSAQRSRVRKLQYISELERTVTSQQSEVSVLTPRVMFLDRQRVILIDDNSALKQRIAALAQDKIFKDAHQEALKQEIERLGQIDLQKNLKNENNNDIQNVGQADNNVNSSKMVNNPTVRPLSTLQQIPIHLSTFETTITSYDN